MRQDETKLLTISDVSDMLSVRQSWLRSQIFKGNMKHVKVGRLIRFREKDIVEFVEKNTKEEREAE